jgi:hypothetical protein
MPSFRRKELQLVLCSYKSEQHLEVPMSFASVRFAIIGASRALR